MSSRSEAKTPQLEREAISPSPARNASQSNLESGLTLTRKKSWFGSAREWASKGAHHAKGYFDKHNGIRAETGRGRQPEADETYDGGLLSPELECSDDDTSRTPFKRTSLRHRTFTPKTAVASLRQHTQSAKGRHKRGALSGNHGLEADSAIAEHGMSTPTSDAPKGHGRKSSTAKSLVGSLRGLGRKATAARTTSPEKVLEQRESSLSSDEDAAFVPLPSSPINITPLPTLALNLPPSALVPESFGRTPPDDSELMRQTDPRNMVSARPVPTYYTRIPGEGLLDHINLPPGCADKAWSPRELLGLGADDVGILSSPGPTTPMPGTNCSLGLDGSPLPIAKPVPLAQASPQQNFTKAAGVDSANDETELFERNVEYKDEIKKKGHRTLKRMVSLDAMAEKCAAFTPTQRRSPTLGNLSDVTIQECPDGMPKLTRQWAHLQTPSAGHRCPQTGDWKSEDPFAPGNAIGDLAVDGPPASGAQVILPLRPKITLQSADSAEPQTLNDLDLPMLVDSMENSAVVTDQPTASTDKVQVCEWSDLEMPSHNNPLFVSETAPMSEHNMTPMTRPDLASNVESETAVRPETPISEVATEERAAQIAHAGHAQSDLDALSNENTTGNVDDAQEHLAYEPSHYGSDQDSMHSPLYRKSSVMQIYELLTKHQTPSPTRMATGVISSNTAAALWKFRPWNPSPPSTAKRSLGNAIDKPPRPRRRSSDLEVELSESGRSPETRSTVSPRDIGETPSMGDRVEFDVGCAERAKGDAAVTDFRNRDGESGPVVFEDLDSALALSALRSARKDEAETKDGASSGEEYPPSRARSRRDSGHASCYSVDSDLQADLAGIYELQNAMSGTTFDPNPVTVEDSGPMTPTPSSAQVLQQPGAGSADEEPQSTSSYLASSPAEDTPTLSPGETNFWREVQSCPFDTPQQTPSESPSHSLQQRQSTAILSAMLYIGEDSERAVDAVVESALPCIPDDDFQQITAQEDTPPTGPQQTLDEGLKLYHSYTSNPDMRYSDSPTASSRGSLVEHSSASPDSKYNPDQSSDADDEPASPTAYRSVKTTAVSPPR